MLPSPTTENRRRAARAGLLAALWLGMQVNTALADIDIQISGVDGELRRNVLAYLSLERYKGRDDLDANLVERLQERAVREAAAALRPFGYYEAKVEANVEQIDATRWRARLVIDTGIPVMMQDVILQVEGPGIEHPAFRDILRNPPLKVGMRLDHAAYDSIKDSLRRTAATLGFVEAQLTKSELRVDPEDGDGHIDSANRPALQLRLHSHRATLVG
jgi:translocation and assembly module TamA